MKEHADLGEEGKPRACVSRMRTPGTGPADALSLWYFLALTPPPAPTPTSPLWFNDSLSTFPQLPGWQSPESPETLENGIRLGEKDRQQAGFSGSSRQPMLLWPQEMSLSGEDGKANEAQLEPEFQMWEFVLKPEPEVSFLFPP